MSFAQFWDAYPRKVAKIASQKAFARINPDAATVDRMLAALQGTDWPDPQYIPHPATWLNGRRWEDEGNRVKRNPVPRARHSEMRNQRMVDEWLRYYPR